jgi:signal transduction histidine kinase
MQAERLAAIGQAMTGLAHESRNALQRSQACLQRLAWRLHDQDEALELLERAQQAHSDLVRLFEDVRSFAAPIRLHRAPCDLSQVWREALAQVSSQFSDMTLEIWEDTAGLDLRCLADRHRLLQVFRNLFDNAFAVATGSVRLDISCSEALLGDRQALKVAVRDYGPGLIPAQRPRLFEAFYTTKTKGTGLGLAITRRIIEAHGGEITVAATPPPGMEFHITLPCQFEGSDNP